MAEVPSRKSIRAPHATLTPHPFSTFMSNHRFHTGHVASLTRRPSPRSTLLVSTADGRWNVPLQAVTYLRDLLESGAPRRFRGGED